MSHLEHRRLCALIAFSAVIFLLSGCSLFGDAGLPELEVGAVEAQYVLGGGAVVSPTIRNVSDQPIYYNRCMGVTLEEYDGADKVAGFSFPVCLCLCIVDLEGGEALPEGVPTTALDWLLEHSGDLQFEPGFRYRLRYEDFFADRQLRQRLPEEQRVTDWFTLAVAEPRIVGGES